MEAPDLNCVLQASQIAVVSDGPRLTIRRFGVGMVQVYRFEVPALPVEIETAPLGVVEVSNYLHQTSLFAQTTLRSALGEVELDELLARREKINMRLQSILDTHPPWGVKVANVEVKQVDIPESMLRAMTKQAEAEREKRSKIIHAEGEFSAAQRLVDGAHLLATERSTSSSATCRR